MVSFDLANQGNKLVCAFPWYLGIENDWPKNFSPVLDLFMDNLTLQTTCLKIYLLKNKKLANRGHLPVS